MIKRKVFKSEVHRRRKEGNRGKDYKPSSKSHFGILSLSLRLCEQNYWISNLFFNPFFASAIWAWIIFVTQSRELLHGFQFINLFWEDCPRFKVCCFFIICLTRINTHHFQLLQQQFPYLALVKNCKKNGKYLLDLGWLSIGLTRLGLFLRALLDWSIKGTTLDTCAVARNLKDLSSVGGAVSHGVEAW